MPTCASCNKQSDKMLVCAKCKSANYCNRECQVHHWKHGGHKKACGLATSSDSSSKTHSNVAPPTSAPKNSSNTQKQPIDEDDPVHPCPICLEQEDMFGDCGQCVTCGQTFCGNCKPEIGALGKCPTYRAPFDCTPYAPVVTSQAE